MAVLDGLEELCKTVLDPSYELSEKEIEHTHILAMLVKEWRQTGLKPKGLLHELLILHDLSGERAMATLNRLRKIYGD